MSLNFKLGLFGNLGEYLVAATSGANGANDAAKKYYLQKYYTKIRDAKDLDVTPAFTDAIVELAQTFRTFDKSTSAVASLKSILMSSITSYVNDLTITIPKTATATVPANFTSPIDTATINSARLVNGLKLDVSTLRTQLSTVINSSLLSTTDKTTATTNISSLLLTDASPFNLIGGDDNAMISTIKTQLIKQTTKDLTKWITDNYTTKPITGDTDVVKTDLTKLKNGEISEIELKLFNMFMDVLDVESNNVVKINDIDLHNLSNYRINIKMTDIIVVTGSSKIKTPSIVEYLPELNPASRVIYNGDKVVSNPDLLLLKRVFQETYATNDPKPALPEWNEAKKSVGLLQPNLEALMTDIIKRKVSPSAHITDDELDKIDDALIGKWTRIGTDTWKHRLSDGTDVVFRPDSTEFNEEVSNEVNNCAAIGFKSDVAECKKFLTEIAMNTNPTKLAEIAIHMTDDVAAKTVADLHPKYALAILKAFGFHRKLCKDKIAGRQIEKVQRADEWLKTFVSKKFTDEQTVIKIKANTKLTHFLDLLAQLVNANPSVLNDAYADETEESTGSVLVPEKFAQRKIVAVRSRNSGKPVMSWSQITDNMNKVYGSFSKGLTFDGTSTNSPFGMDNLFPSMVLPTSANIVRGSTWGSMSGGGDKKTFLQEHDTAFEYSHNIFKIFNELLENLRNSGKNLNDDDLKILNTKLADFKKLEENLLITAKDIQTYSQLLKVLEAEKRSEIITESHIKKYVEKYNHLLNKYEKTGSSFNTLISLLKDCGDDDKATSKDGGEL